MEDGAVRGGPAYEPTVTRTLFLPLIRPACFDLRLLSFRPRTIFVNPRK